MFSLMDVTISLMFGMALLMSSGQSETLEVPLAPQPKVAENAGAPQADDRPVVTIDEKGAVTVNGQPTVDDQLTATVRKLTASAPSDTRAKTPVRMQAHPQVAYGRLFAVRERLREEFNIIEIGKIEQP